MAATDGQILLAAARWGDEGHYLREFVAKNQLPQIVKIIKGQYMNLGVPTLPNPSLHSTVLLVSAGWRLKIVAQSVKFKEGRRVIPVGPKFSIPDSYGGFFEILSEDGRPVRCIESVAELARRFPDSCLVRDNIRAYVSRSEDINGITEKSRTVPAGETLVLVGEVIGTKGKGQNRFLRCFDSKGENVYLPYDQRGRFSAIAKEDNISGVHSVKNLLIKRMPLMVRLVHGTPPLGIKNPSHFIPELRLYATFEEEHMFALPLQKDSTIMSVPMSAPLKLQKAKNEEQLKSMKEFLRLTEKSGRLMADVVDRIQVFDATLSKEMRFGDKQWKAHPKAYFLRRSVSTDSAHHSHRHHHRTGKSAPPSPPVQDENENPAMDDYDEIDQIYDYVRGFAPLPKTIKPPFVKAEDNNSPASSPTSTPSHVEVPVIDKLPPDDSPKPEPPPIETIPTKRLQQTPPEVATSPVPEGVTVLVNRSSSKTDLKEKRRERSGEKRTRKASLGTSSVAIGTATEKSPGLKLYIKSANHRNAQKARIFRHKSSSPLKETPPLRVSTTTVMAQQMSPVTVKSMSPSPLFNIRYKSLTNLAMDFDTLDSSNSGGRTSGDSAGSAAKLPEKRSRRLSRPRSLTNLVWEIRGNSPTPPSTPNPIVSSDPNPTRHPLILPPPPDLERQVKLEPRVYRKNSKDSKMGSAVQKRIGTLYL